MEMMSQHLFMMSVVFCLFDQQYLIYDGIAAIQRNDLNEILQNAMNAEFHLNIILGKGEC